MKLKMCLFKVKSETVLFMKKIPRHLKVIAFVEINFHRINFQVDLFCECEFSHFSRRFIFADTETFLPSHAFISMVVSVYHMYICIYI